jgi:hypothetical protein
VSRVSSAINRRRRSGDEPVFIDQRALRRRLRADASAIRVEDALHRPRTRTDRGRHLSWLLVSEALLAYEVPEHQFESVLNDWLRRRAPFVSERDTRRTARLFPMTHFVPAAPRRAWLL